MVNKIICPDCEMECEELQVGVCKKCYRRKANKKSRGQEYTKLKDIKGSEEYNRAMGRREINDIKYNKANLNVIKKEVKKKTVVKEIKEVNIDNNVIDDYTEQRVLSDIENCFKTNGLDLTLLSKNEEDYSLYDTIKIIKQFVNRNAEDNIFVKAENVMNKISTDYSHRVENSIDNYDAWLQNAKEHSCLLSYRRKLKNVLTQQKSINRFILKFKENKELLNLLSDCEEELKNINDNIKSPKYNVFESKNMLEEEDFVQKQVAKPQIIKPQVNNKPTIGKYLINVKITGVSKCDSPKLFTRYTNATSEAEAINIVKEFIKTKFRNVKVNEKSLTCVKIG